MVQDNKTQRPRFNRNRQAPISSRFCRDCQSSDIKARTNYSHGKKSKSITVLTCNNCNSSNIQVNKPMGRR